MAGDESKLKVESIKEGIKQARTVLYLYLGFLSYCALTVVSTQDRQLVIPGEDVHLPIVNLEVSLNGFFIVAPALCILFFIYLMFFHIRISWLIEDLRKTGAVIDNPWLLGLEGSEKKDFLALLRWFGGFLVIWLYLPLVLGLFGIWYLKKHEPVMSYILGLAVPVLGTWLSLIFWLYKNRFRKLVRDYTLVFSLVQLGLVGTIYLFLTLLIPPINKGDIAFFNLDLSYQVLVEVPEKDKDFENVYWANLRGANLQGANLESSVLQRADLRGADLRKATLFKAKLFKADLTPDYTKDETKFTNLQGAFLWNADFKGAKLLNVKLKGANLLNAKLKGANLLHAKLKGAVLKGAELQGADLRRADLKGAILFNVNLKDLPEKKDKDGKVIQEAKKTNVKASQLCKALTLYESEFELELEKQLKLKTQCAEKLKRPDWDKLKEDHKNFLVELLGELPEWFKNEFDY